MPETNVGVVRITERIYHHMCTEHGLTPKPFGPDTLVVRDNNIDELCAYVTGALAFAKDDTLEDELRRDYLVFAADAICALEKIQAINAPWYVRAWWRLTRRNWT